MMGFWVSQSCFTAATPAPQHSTALHCAALRCTAWHCALASNLVTGTQTLDSLQSPALWRIFEAALGTLVKHTGPGSTSNGGTCVMVAAAYGLC